MAKDIRHYAKFTLDFPDNPKILPLSDAAFRCLVEATIWSRRHQTDGFLPRAVAVAQARACWSLEILHELCNNDPDFPSLSETENGWIIHDYAQHQDTKAEIRARLEQAKSAGRKGGQASAQARAQPRAKPRAQATAQAKSNQRKRNTLAPTGLESNAHRASPNGRGAASLTPDEAIRRCGLCDNRGYIGLAAGPFVSCPHDRKQIEELEQQNAGVF